MDKIEKETSFYNYLKLTLINKKEGKELFYLRFAITEINKNICLIETKK